MSVNVIEVPGVTQAQSPAVVRVRFRHGGYKAVMDAMAGGSLHLRRGQFAVRDGQQGVTWLLRLPAGRTPLGDYRHADVERAPGVDGPAAPLTADEWRRLEYALDGVADDTWGPESLRNAADLDGDRYFWDGLVPDRGVTLLAGAPKGGKSTLLRALLRSASAAWGQSEAAGEDRSVPLLGRGVAAFKSLVVSEERRQDWRECPAGVRVRLFEGRPLVKGWRDYVAGLGTLAGDYTFDEATFGSGLVVLDSFSRICGVDENNARQVTRAMAPVRDLAHRCGVLIVHHLNRSGGVRGSGALEAQADHVLTVEAVNPDDPTDTRRTLTSVGRSGAPARIGFEMRPDGSLVQTTPPGVGVPARRPAYLSRKAGC